MSHPNLLDRKKAALIVIDVQEGFRNAIPDFGLTAERIAVAVKGFLILNVPVLVTEQYPKGLGATATEIRDAFTNGFEAIEKTAFSSCDADGFVAKLKELDIEQAVLCGLETHVCVNQRHTICLIEAFKFTC